MYFVSMEMLLKPIQCNQPISYGNSAHAHAAFLKMISSIEPQLGQAFHEKNQRRHFTTALILPSPPYKKSMVKFRITFMGRDAFDHAQMLLNLEYSSVMLTIGRHEYAIEQINFGKDHLGSIATWADICKQSNSTKIAYRFVTPTAINQKSGTKRFANLLPMPINVFSNLIKRWDELGGSPLTNKLNTYLAENGIVISDHNIEVVTFGTQKRTQKGFVGNVTYECLNDEPECVVALNQLSRLSFYTGIGYQTARGMGMVEPMLAD